MKTERLIYYRRLAHAGNKNAQRVVDAFDPDQPRDSDGKWGEGGGGGGGNAAEAAKTPVRFGSTVNVSGREMSPKMAELFRLGQEKKIGNEYSRLSRNPDDAVRAQWKQNKEVEGTHEWAVFQMMAAQSKNYSDEMVDKIKSALKM